MPTLASLRATIRSFWRTLTCPDDLDRDVDRELDSCFEMAVDEKVAAGMSAAEARRRVRLEFGARDQIKERVRDIRFGTWLDDLRRDGRLAIRLLLKQWRFSALVIVVLALGTGANTTLFSVANALLFKPLPAERPERLVWIYGGATSNVPYAAYRDYRDATTTLTGLAGFGHQTLSLGVGVTSRLTSGQLVTTNYFDVLGLRPWLGRLFQPGDDVGDRSAEVAVIGYALWERRFGADTDVVGRSVTVNGRSFEVVGVTPPGFGGILRPLDADLWIPVATPEVEPPSLHVVGRMADDVPPAAVEAEVTTLRARFARADPDRHFFQTLSVYPASGTPPIMRAVAPFVFPLLGLVTLALLVACFNLASLMLARSSGRRHEVSMRMALGATRGRLVRQLLTESALLTLVGTAAGVILVRWASGLLVAVDLPVPDLAAVALDVTIDWRVLLFAGGSAGVAVLTFGLTPVLQVTRHATPPTLRREVSSLGGRRSSRTRAALISAQLALSVVLLTATGLLWQSWRNAVATDIGFDPDPVLAVGVNPTAGGYDSARRQAFYQQLTAQLGALSGGLTASAVEIVPLTMSSRSALLLRPGEPVPPPLELAATAPRSNNVTPGYFETVGIPLLAGRDFGTTDGPLAPAVTIVDEALADRVWPGENPIGQRLRRLQGPPPFSENETEIEVIGVVANAKYATVGEDPRTFAYFPLLQADPENVTILVKGPTDPLAGLPAVRDLISRVDPNVPIAGETPLSAMTSVSLMPVSAAGILVGGIGLLTMVLAVIGVSGVLLYLVRQRTAEVGVRIALGASRRAIASLIAGESIRWLLTGLSVGLVLSVVLGRFVSSFLYGVSPTEPVVLIGAVLLLTLVTGVASLIPARRAWRTDPMTALRAE